MDADGIAAEVIFHGSMNGEMLPWESGGDKIFGTGGETAEIRELMTVGRHLFNQWLADFCSVQPERHIGCAQVPIWDIAATLREIEWANEHGLRGVNWPASRYDMNAEYNDPEWEPVWSACEEFGMTLNTHSGAVVPGLLDKEGRPVPLFMPLLQAEAGGWLTRRGIGRMVLSGVFERHPGLKLVLTEATRRWWPYTLPRNGRAVLPGILASDGHFEAAERVLPQQRVHRCEFHLSL